MLTGPFSPDFPGEKVVAGNMIKPTPLPRAALRVSWPKMYHEKDVATGDPYCITIR